MYITDVTRHYVYKQIDILSALRVPLGDRGDWMCVLPGITRWNSLSVIRPTKSCSLRHSSARGPSLK
jgi:hypothetical protein